jgi:hypothetical protein
MSPPFNKMNLENLFQGPSHLTISFAGGWGLSKDDVLVYDCGPLGIEDAFVLLFIPIRIYYLTLVIRR